MSVMVYRLSRALWLTSDMVRHLEGRISILNPSTRNLIQKKVGRQLIKIYILGLTTATLLFLFSELSFYFCLIVMATIYMVADSSIHKGLNKIELRLLSQFLTFIESVKFKFQFDGMIEEAILEAIRDGKYEISVHGQIIYEHLKESYFTDKCDYQEISPNQFFLTFYSLCESVMKYGDKKTDKGSLFVRNLSYLKEDINDYILKQQAINNTFMGLTWICILPMYCLKPIEIWALSNMPELKDYYSGRNGIVINILLTLMSIGIYCIISSLKYPTGGRVVKKAWVERLSKIKWIYNINTRYMNCFVGSMGMLESLLKSVAYPYNVAEFCIKRFITSMLAFCLGVVVSLTIGFGILSIPIGIIAFVFLYKGQIVIIKLKKQLLLLEREDEIIRFQGIILMLMHADSITVEQILSQLERFAVGFKREIQEISDKLSYKGMVVFKEYKHKTEFLPFSRIIDGFIACDEMYIHKAFEDVETDRKYYIEKHKQENKFYIEQRGAISKFLSFIPICAVVIVKIVVPFVIEGMNQMSMGGFNL